MLNKSLIAALAGGIIAVAGTAFAQDSDGAAKAVVAPDRVVVTHELVVTHRDAVPVAAAPSASNHTIRGGSGGVGGAIGGYYINGSTRADNRPLPGGTWPYR